MNIEKRAAELTDASYGIAYANNLERIRETAIQLAREAADARAEEIALELESARLFPGDPGDFLGIRAKFARIARSTITKSRTREERYREALESITCLPECGRFREPRNGLHAPGCSYETARRALEGRP